MGPRILPEPDRFAVCPDEGRVLAFYEGVFDSVYVLLHPFIRPVSMSMDEFEGGRYPERPRVLDCCAPVSWSEIQRLGNFSSLDEIDVALRTRVLGLKEELCDYALASMLSRIEETEGLIEPSKGEFGDLSHDIILEFIRKQGYDWVWVGDEFCTERKLHWIEDLMKADSVATLGHCNVFTPDHKVLWTTHWDSYFSFFCGTNEFIAELAKEANLEGFACNDRTEVYWSVR
jgi:hypothetical protein